MNKPVIHDSFWVRNRKTGGALLQIVLKRKIGHIVRALLLIGLAFLIIQPVLDKLFISIMAENDLYDTTILLIPRHPSLEAYSVSLMLLEFNTAFWNSLWVCVSGAIVQVAAATLVAYGFARFDFPLKRLWYACVILIIIIPPQTISSSLFVHFTFFDVFGIIKAITGNTFNLRSTPISYYMLSATCMGLRNGLYIFMLRQFFRAVPKSLEEAAYVDGCSSFKTFYRIMLPQGIPVIASCLLFSFVWQWTDIFYTRLTLPFANHMLAIRLSSVAEVFRTYIDTQTEMATPPVALLQQMISTSMLIVIAPLLIIYIIAQRAFVESITATGLKD